MGRLGTAMRCIRLGGMGLRALFAFGPRPTLYAVGGKNAWCADAGRSCLHARRNQSMVGFLRRYRCSDFDPVPRGAPPRMVSIRQLRNLWSDFVHGDRRSCHSTARAAATSARRNSDYHSAVADRLRRMGAAIKSGTRLMPIADLPRPRPRTARTSAPSIASMAGPRPPPPPPPPPDGAGVAATVTVWEAEPPGPVHMSDKVTVALMTTAVEPVSASGPVQPVLPLAVQAVAFWLLQVSVTV